MVRAQILALRRERRLGPARPVVLCRFRDQRCSDETEFLAQSPTDTFEIRTPGTRRDEVRRLRKWQLHGEQLDWVG